ncbi:hypothetical protein B0T20DRAFT_450711 [Sordaria brevicollis]|uniref:SMP-30/Gluconolactonase/LRE-like region domain-containing protein n=1 Tax=Sordaria brevicollis TaxID=83679 RepID=A0AAE0PKZ0_SORBR|nr:hypothetical protein B0T20DRAFT_450711 [Sordaria brevicollis]
MPIRTTNGSTPKRTTIHTFSEVEALFGITEPVDDLFVVVGGNVSSNGNDHGNGEGSWFFTWTIDFRHTTTTTTTTTITHDNEPTSKKPEIKQITRLSKAVLPNGLASVPENPDVVLIADSFAGLVWRLDIRTGSYDVAVQVPEMAAPANGSGVVGVNGVKVHGGYLYWTNSATVSIYRVRLDRKGYRYHYHYRSTTAAEVELVADLSLEAPFLDDFAVREDGVIFVATNSGNKLFAVDTDPKKKVVLVGGAETELTFAGGTAAAFGRDNKMLYVTTCGGLRTPINGTVVEGGKVVGVDTGEFAWL